MNCNYEQNLQIFSQVLDYVLFAWPALRLAMDNDGDGYLKASIRRNNLREAVLDFWADSSFTGADGSIQTDLDIDDLAELFEAYFEDVFEVAVEDGSLDSTAAYLIKLWEKVKTKGVADEEIVSLLQKNQDRLTKNNAPPAVEQPPQQEEAEMDVIETEEEQPEAPLVDEDGWQTVDRRRRKKK